MKHSIIRVLAIAAVAAATTIAPVSSAHADDTHGHSPTWEVSCGAYRDFPSQWHHVDGQNPVCATTGFSWIWTSPSTVHTATWDFTSTTADQATLEVEAWIPNVGASQEVEYDYQLCGASTWKFVGDLDQAADDSAAHGTWYAVGRLTLQPDQGVCRIRIRNTGSASWDMAEDALGLYKVSG